MGCITSSLSDVQKIWVEYNCYHTGDSILDECLVYYQVSWLSSPLRAPPHKTRFFKKISILSFLYRKVPRRFLFQNMYGFLKKDKILTDLSQETSTLFPSFPSGFCGFLNLFIVFSQNMVSNRKNWNNFLTFQDITNIFFCFKGIKKSKLLPDWMFYIRFLDWEKWNLLLWDHLFYADFYAMSAKMLIKMNVSEFKNSVRKKTAHRY